MFGYIVVNKPEMKFREFDVYQSYYCGLCKSLKDNYGKMGQITLSYDMTFLALLLTSLYEPETVSGYRRCAVHPAKKHFYRQNEFTDYAADMNILLSSAGCSVSDLLRLFHFQSQADKRFPRRPTLHIELLHSLCDEVSQNIWILSNVWH